MERRFATTVLALALALAGSAPSASALSITGITVATTGANTGSSSNDTGANRQQVASAAALLGSAPGPVADRWGSTVSLAARYAHLVAADREAGGGTTSQSATASYTITFTVVNPLGGNYQVDFDTSRLGALTLVDDGGGDATATLGAVTGLVDGVADAGLALPAVTTTASGGANQGFSQTGSTLSIRDSALSRTFTLTFSWTSTATGSRDEAAVRMGLGGTLTGVTADDYPGVGGRSASGDGHLVDVLVTMLNVPEPSTFVLVAAGLALLAGRRRAPTRPRV